MSSASTPSSSLPKARRPEVYRERANLELTGRDGGPLQAELPGGLNEHERVALRRAIDAILADEHS